jgi:hypothetical protein
MMKNFTGFAELWEKVKSEFFFLDLFLFKKKIGTRNNCKNIYGIQTING